MNGLSQCDTLSTRLFVQLRPDHPVTWHNQHNSTNPTNPWVGGVLLIVTDRIQSKVRLGLMPNQFMVGGILLIVTDHIQG